MNKILRGGLTSLMWFCNVMAGCTLFIGPLLPLLLISPATFRKVEDFLYRWVSQYYIIVTTKMLGIKFIVSGDRFIPNESAVFICNHRTASDPLFVARAVYESSGSRFMHHMIKPLMKSVLGYIPFIGWSWQTSGFLLLSRNWSKDQIKLTRWLAYQIELKQRYQIMLFPEGTAFRKLGIQRSNEYARSHGLPKYKYVLHPKTTGFSFIVNHLQQANYLDAIYDITIAYPDCVPQNEWSISVGSLPDEVHMNVRKISRDDVPKGDKQLRSFLEDIWKQKESDLKDFNTKKNFGNEPWTTPDSQFQMLMLLIFWNSVTVLIFVLLITSTMFRMYFLCLILLFSAICSCGGDIHTFEINWFWKRKSLGL